MSPHFASIQSRRKQPLSRRAPIPERSACSPGPAGPWWALWRASSILAMSVLALVLLALLAAPGQAAAAPGAPPAPPAPGQPAAAIWLGADMTYDRVHGQVAPGASVLITATDSAGQVKGTAMTGADGSGWFNDMELRLPGQEQADLRPGDVVSIQDSTGQRTSTTLTPINALVDAAADTVTGQVLNGAYPATVRVEIWRFASPTPVTVQSDGSGNFSAHFATFDIKLGDDASIWYVRPDGNQAGIHRSDLLLDTSVRQSNVNGQTRPRTRVDLTLDGAAAGNGPHARKAQATVWSDYDGQYHAQFRDLLDHEVLIQPGDTVTAQVEGKTATVAVPSPYTAVYDHAANTVCGQAPAYTPLQVDLFGFGTREKISEGNGAYCVDFTSGGDPGIDAAGMVRRLSTEREIARLNFATLTPELWLQQQAQGQAPAGGEFQWYLAVGNESNATAAAPNTILTDTLPADMAFVSESTGGATVAGDQVVWHLGSLAPGAARQITVTVRVKNGVAVGANLHNCAAVTAGAWERNPGNNGACDDRQVAANEVDLGVNQSASNGSPAPDAEFVYRINVNNDRPAMAAGVRITDTLPPEVTLLSTWQPAGWTVDTSVPGRVVWRSDHVPGWTGRWVEARVRLNANVPPNTQVRNHVEIGSASPDPNAGNNSNDQDVYPKAPYGDMGVSQAYRGGNPIPGGEYRQILNVENHGNTTASGVVLTDTLPAGATFLWSRRWDFNPATGDMDVPAALSPSAQGAGWVRWNLGSVPNWRQTQVEVAFRVPGAAPGATLTNVADVSGLPAETNPADNHSVFTFTTQAPGPNLHVDQWLQGNALRPGNGLQYHVNFRNDGTEPVYHVVLTDTLPEHVAFQGQNYWPNPTVDGRNLIWQIPDRFDPGRQDGLQVNVQIANDAPPNAALANTLAISTSTPEVRYDDNQATDVHTVQNPYHIRVNQTHNWVNGTVLPGAHYQVTLRAPGGAAKSTVEGNADGGGGFMAFFDKEIDAGDRVDVDTAGTPTISLDVVRMEGAVNAGARVLAGKVYSATYPATVYGEVFADRDGAGPYPAMQTDGSGNFSYSYAAYPVKSGTTLALWYVRPDGHEIGFVRSALRLEVEAWGINGSTTQNTPVNVTLRDAQGHVKATGQATANADGYWFTRVYAGSEFLPITALDQLQVTAGANSAGLAIPALQALADSSHDILQLYSGLPNTGLKVQWDSGPDMQNSDLAHQTNVTTAADGSARLGFMQYGGMPLGLSGRVQYDTPEDQTVGWWWHGMIDKVDPIGVVNDKPNLVHVIGDGFYEPIQRVRLNAPFAPQTVFTVTNAGWIATSVISFTLPAGAPAGIYDLLVDNADMRTGYLFRAITIANPLPSVTAILPGSGHWDESLNFTLHGANFVSGATVRLAQGQQVFRTATNVVVTSPGQLTGLFDLSGLAAGKYDVVVSNPGPSTPTSGLSQALEVKPRWKIMLPLLRKSG
jgi:uncharacterized repeat protein (TIGR01451 family)